MFKTIYERITEKFSTALIRFFSGIECGKGVVFKKLPSVIKRKTAVIKIGKGTTVNSSNFGYHINMHSKCKLYADRENALIEIGENCRIHGTCIHAFKKIVIGNNCLIAANTQIIDANGHQLCMVNPEKRLTSPDHGEEIIINDNVWIGASCIILGGTEIGEGSVISAASVIRGKVPPKSLFGGNPAKLIKQYPNFIDKLEESKNE